MCETVPQFIIYYLANKLDSQNPGTQWDLEYWERVLVQQAWLPRVLQEGGAREENEKLKEAMFSGSPERPAPAKPVQGEADQRDLGCEVRRHPRYG